MATKVKAAKAGLTAARKAPAKRQLARGGAKLGRRKAERSTAGTAFFYTQALVGHEDARDELADAYRSARKAYRRASGRGGPAALVEDRKAWRALGDALQSLREALRVAGRKRRKPRSAKLPVIVVLAGAGTGAAVVIKRRQDHQPEQETADAAA